MQDRLMTRQELTPTENFEKLLLDLIDYLKGTLVPYEDQHGQVQCIHDGRPEVHPNFAYILTDSVHEVSRVIGLIKRGVQPLVLIEDFTFEIKLDSPGHDNDGLSCEKKENAFDEVGQQKQSCLPKCQTLHPSKCIAF